MQSEKTLRLFRKYLFVIRFCCLGIFVLSALQLEAQDTLPNFIVQKSNNKIIVRWIIQNKKVIQINVQRSADSLTGFKTIYALEEPTSQRYEYIDTKALNDNQFYRLYIVDEGGTYLFTVSRKPSVVIPTSIKPIVIDNVIIAQNASPKSNEKINPTIIVKAEPIKKTISEPLPENVLASLIEPKKTSNNLIAYNSTRIMKFASALQIPQSAKRLIPVHQDSSYPHIYVYVNPQGYVEVIHPELKNKKVNINFYKEDGTNLFSLNDVKESQLILDKTNFLQSGWFFFELYENGKFMVRQKFYLPK